MSLDALLAASAKLAVKPDPAQAKALVTGAAKTVLNDRGVRDALSLESKALLGSLATAAATAAQSVDWSKVVAASQSSPGALAAEVAMSASAIAVGVLAASGPVGAAAAAVYGVFLGMASAFQAEADAIMASRISAKEKADNICFGAPALRIFLNPPGTGKGGAVVPADLFALAPFPLYTGTCASTNKKVVYRPALGGALIRLLEGGLDEGATPTQTHRLAELDAFAAAHPELTIGGSIGGVSGLPVTRRYYEPMWQAIRKALKDQALGIPLERRKLFRMLRQLIEWQHGVKGSDGGASLYHVYVDLLNDEFNRGHLPRDATQLDRILFFHATTPDSNKATEKRYEVNKAKWEEWDHPSPIAVLLADLVHRWETTVNPNYAADIAEREKQAKFFNVLSQVSALKEVSARGSKMAGAPPMPTLIPRALYDQLSPAQREQLNVRVRPSFIGMPRRGSTPATSPLFGVLLFGAAGVAAGALFNKRRKKGD